MVHVEIPEYPEYSRAVGKTALLAQLIVPFCAGSITSIWPISFQRTQFLEGIEGALTMCAFSPLLFVSNLVITFCALEMVLGNKVIKGLVSPASYVISAGLCGAVLVSLGCLIPFLSLGLYELDCVNCGSAPATYLSGMLFGASMLGGYCGLICGIFFHRRVFVAD